jgi:tetratricopeptide (TPR) repeat protein
MSAKRSIVVSFAVNAVLAGAVVAAVHVLAPEPARPRRNRPAAPLPMTPEVRRIIQTYLIEARKNRQFNRIREALEYGERALMNLRDRGAELEAAALLVELGEWYVDAGDVSRAAAYLRAGYSKSTDAAAGCAPAPPGAVGPREEWLSVAAKAEAKHRDLAFSLSDKGEDRAALSILEEMLKEFRRRGDRTREAQALHNQAWVISDNGRHQEAVRLYERALAIRRETGDREGQAWTLNNMAVSHLRDGDLASSRARIFEALEAAGKEFPEVWMQALDNLILLSQEARKKKEHALALSALEAVVPAVLERDELFLYERVWLERALALRESGNGPRACEVLDELVAWERRARYSYGGALFVYEKAVTLALDGKADDALEIFEIAVRIQETLGDVQGAATTREAAGRALRNAGRAEEALPWLRDSAAGFESAGPDLDGLKRVLPDLAACFDALGRKEEADRAQRRLEDVKILQPPGDLPRFVYIEGCEGREILIAGMRLDDDLVRVRRTEDGWKFLDLATGREAAVPFSWQGRHVVFQGKDFRVQGPILFHRGFRVFLAVGEEAGVAVGGKFYRRGR